MIKISILYPNKEGQKFDFDYYVKTHMPMSIHKMGEKLRGVSVEQGISGGTPGSAPPFVAACHFLFDTGDEFLAAYMPNAAILQADMPNYTDIEPVIQFSEVRISR